MGLLDGLLGGAVGAEVVTVVNSLIQQHGGVQGIVTQLEQQGLGNTVRSWVGTGPNQPISPDQVDSAFGGVHQPDRREDGHVAAGADGRSSSHVLPAAIDHLTPGGTVPAKNA